MRRYQDIEILKAKELRKTKGYSFAELQRITGIPATTIRNWCRGESMVNRWETLLKSNDRKREELKASELNTFDVLGDITPAQAKIYVALLYWCEGWKYPSSNKIGFTNSDKDLLKLFISLLRKSFNLDESRFRVHLQLHTTHDVGQMKYLWSTILRIPTSQFLKPTITPRRGGKHRKDYYGTCTVRYPDCRIQLKLIGLYESFARRFGETI